MTKALKVEFAPGCFDDFEGTQEELDSLIAEITSLAASGELFNESNVVEMVDLDDVELTEDDIEELDTVLRPTTPRTLQ